MFLVPVRISVLLDPLFRRSLIESWMLQQLEPLLMRRKMLMLLVAA